MVYIAFLASCSVPFGWSGSVKFTTVWLGTVGLGAVPWVFPWRWCEKRPLTDIKFCCRSCRRLYTQVACLILRPRDLKPEKNMIKYSTDTWPEQRPEIPPPRPPRTDEHRNLCGTLPNGAGRKAEGDRDGEYACDTSDTKAESSAAAAVPKNTATRRR